MNGKACAGTGEQVHLIIFTCARNAREEIKTGEKKRKGIAGEKRWREEKDYRKTEIQRKIPGKFTISKEGVLGKGDLL